jgi:copper homeostasis protein
MKLEICAYNIHSCLVAQKAGASRIELCADPLQGGTTPSYGLIKFALENVMIPVYPIIRPRGGSFCYDESELEIIKSDILMCRQLGCEGISTGVSLPDGSIDIAAMKLIKEWASPMEVSCHKVFDAAPDLQKALEDLITAGCDRVLTSGGCKTAFEGIDIIAGLISQANGRIIVMAGGSARSENLPQLMTATKAIEYHSSAITVNDNNFMADETEVKKMVEILNA